MLLTLPWTIAVCAGQVDLRGANEEWEEEENDGGEEEARQRKGEGEGNEEEEEEEDQKFCDEVQGLKEAEREDGKDGKGGRRWNWFGKHMFHFGVRPLPIVATSGYHMLITASSYLIIEIPTLIITAVSKKRKKRTKKNKQTVLRR